MIFKHLKIFLIFVLFVGTIFNGLEVKTGNSYFNCNYLFMFQKSAAVRLVGDFIGKLFDLKITLFNYYNLYLAQIFVYIVFMIICSLIYFGLYLIFKEKKKYETQ